MLTRSVRNMLRMFIVDAQMLIMKQLVKNVCEFKPLMIRDCLGLARQKICPTHLLNIKYAFTRFLLFKWNFCFSCKALQICARHLTNFRPTISSSFLCVCSCVKIPIFFFCVHILLLLLPPGLVLTIFFSFPWQRSLCLTRRPNVMTTIERKTRKNVRKNCKAQFEIIDSVTAILEKMKDNLVMIT